MMMRPYHSSCLEFTVALVNFQVESCSRLLHHVCQGGYELLNGIDCKGLLQCFEDLRGGKVEVSNKVVDRTVAEIVGSKKYK